MKRRLVSLRLQLCGHKGDFNRYLMKMVQGGPDWEKEMKNKKMKSGGGPIPEDDSLLLVGPVTLRIIDGKIYLEGQACNGVKRWLDNFTSIIFASPVIPEDLAAKDSTHVWHEVDEFEWRPRVEFVPLPWAYRWRDFVSSYSCSRNILRELVSRARYPHLSLSGLAGDWAAVAALEARKLGRPYAVHTDRVEFSTLLAKEPKPTLKRMIKAHIEHPLIKYYQRHIVKSCAVGMWHGLDCYEAYSKWCSNNFKVDDIHTTADDFIGEDGLEAKVESVMRDSPLRLIYAGRISGMKAPLEWVRAIGCARACGADIRALWLGAGPMMDETQKLARDLNLEDVIEFPGFIEDRARVLQHLREAHMFVFTHVTPESPRCLIEAFVSGTPIIGYENAYARDLLEGYGGGEFSGFRHVLGLGRLIAQLARDRPRLAQLIRQAGNNGARWNDESVFRHRSDLLKQHLP